MKTGAGREEELRLMTAPFGANRYKFGLFGANCSGGVTFSAAPERWKAEWDEIAKLYRMADEAGIEFILPVARWLGVGGKANVWGSSFETFTHSAAAAALTKRIGVLVTAHISIITPAFAAKAVASIDHISHGRAGLNIICGWNQDEFNVHGVTIDGERRYDHGLEWFQIFAKLLEGGEPFDWNSEFYKLRGATTSPVSLQRPRPPVMSAASSGSGRAFAAQTADILFTSPPNLERLPGIVDDFKTEAAKYGRAQDVYIQTQFVCRPTRKEAEDFYYYFAEEQADSAALEYIREQKRGTLSRGAKVSELITEQKRMDRFTNASGKSYSGMVPGVYPIIGTPDEIVQELLRLSASGIAGSALIFLNYLDELPYFLQEVFPRMERAGLRSPV